MHPFLHPLSPPPHMYPLYHPLSQDTAQSLSTTFTATVNLALGRLATHAYHRRSSRAAWEEGLLLYRARLRESLASPQQQQPSNRHNGNNNNNHSNNDHNVLAFVSLFTPIDNSFLPSAIDLFTTLSALRVSPTHPLLAYLNACVLGGTGITLYKAKPHENDTKKSEKSGAKKRIDSSSSSSLLLSFVGGLTTIQSAWLMRNGLLPEEIIAEGGLRVSPLLSYDTESNLQTLQRAVSTASSTTATGANASGLLGASGGSGGGGTLEGALGSVDAMAVIRALSSGKRINPSFLPLSSLPSLPHLPPLPPPSRSYTYHANLPSPTPTFHLTLTSSGGSGTGSSRSILPSNLDYQGSGVVAIARRVAGTGLAPGLGAAPGQGLAPLYYFLLQHHLHRAWMAHCMAITRMNALTEKLLGQLLVVIARPMLIATVDAPLVDNTQTQVVV